MAKIEFQGFEEYRARLLDLGANIEGICKYASYDAADIVITAVKENCPVDTKSKSGGGDLRDSIKLYNFKNDKGYVHTGIYFDGYDRDGVPNPLEARVLESGSSTRPKHQFIRPAVNRVKKAAEFSIEAALNRKLDEIMNK